MVHEQKARKLLGAIATSDLTLESIKYPFAFVDLTTNPQGERSNIEDVICPGSDGSLEDLDAMLNEIGRHAEQIQTAITTGYTGCEATSSNLVDCTIVAREKADVSLMFRISIANDEVSLRGFARYETYQMGDPARASKEKAISAVLASLAEKKGC